MSPFLRLKREASAFSLQQVTRLVELLTKPKPLFIDGVRVYAEVAKPLKNQKYVAFLF